MFKTIGARVPAPAGLASPLLWGTEDHLAEIFGSEVEWTHNVRTFTYRFRSADAYVDRFATYYGPTIKALEALGGDAEALKNDLSELALDWNRLDSDAPIAVPATYLESVGVVSGS
jgi:hypothetical protein